MSPDREKQVELGRRESDAAALLGGPAELALEIGEIDLSDPLGLGFALWLAHQKGRSSMPRSSGIRAGLSEKAIAKAPIVSAISSWA